MNFFDSISAISAVLRKNSNDTKAEFVAVVRKGDILISKSSVIAGMVGHAAIMATDLWIIEMPGGPAGGSSASFSSSSSSSSNNQSTTLEDNNRRISKHDWYDEHASDSITVYRCRNSEVAHNAADWAYTHFYNPSGGDEKTIHIRYSLLGSNFWSYDPCYCSKLVLQCYYFGNQSRDVIYVGRLVFGATTAIVPTAIPSYFSPPYTLDVV